jgi:hypothetical protein
MPAWRKNLFIATSRLSTDGAEFFGLPQDRTLIEGSRIEVRSTARPRCGLHEPTVHFERDAKFGDIPWTGE